MTNIKRVKQIDDQIRTLRQIIASGEYEAAGITLSLNVGPLKEETLPDLSVELGITADLDSILTLILQGLTASREFNIGLLKKEAQILNDFLASQTGDHHGQ